jgi:hypothetical protein
VRGDDGLPSLLEPPVPRAGPRSVTRLWILAGAFLATVATLALALLLGSWGFNYRRYSQHERRLQRALEQHPTIGQLTAGLEEEGASVLSSPETPEEMEKAIATFGRGRTEELMRQAAQWPRARVYRAADMLYFVFFDDEGVMRAFTCVGA